jgi:hypothetical protein
LLAAFRAEEAPQAALDAGVHGKRGHHEAAKRRNQQLAAAANPRQFYPLHIHRKKPKALLLTCILFSLVRAY